MEDLASRKTNLSRLWLSRPPRGHLLQGLVNGEQMLKGTPGPEQPQGGVEEEEDEDGQDVPLTALRQTTFPERL